MNDERLIRAIRAGDEAAIDQVITRYSRLLWTVVSAVLGGVAGAQDVEECVADVFIHLWEHPEKFDPKRGKLRSYLAMVARSRAVDRYRASVRRNETSLQDALLIEQAGILEGRLIQEETKRRLLQAVNTLAQPDREILTRRYYYGQKPRQIALAMDMSVKQIDNRLYRAKRQLKQAIIQGEEADP